MVDLRAWGLGREQLGVHACRHVLLAAAAAAAHGLVFGTPDLVVWMGTRVWGVLLKDKAVWMWGEREAGRWGRGGSSYILPVW